ncbi:DUF3237 domain-containing protein [Streptomyces sp. NPDC048111]|uniref:DUF3237 domain-containing protein n=1 Tax=Streptomyces sp. NPDC048111 TaxID=3365500 RepID=UPI0037166118
MNASGGIRTAHLFDMAVDLCPQLPFGKGPFGRRVLFGAAGGTFHGPELHGEVLPGGGDWALFDAEGTMRLDVRLTLRTHDGALLHMTYGGRWVAPRPVREALADPSERHRIDPAHYYFRTTPLFETGAESYAWLNGIVCVGSGRLVERGIAYTVDQVL